MKVYGFTVVTMPEHLEHSPDTETRVFGAMIAMEFALSELVLRDNQEVNTFETALE